MFPLPVLLGLIAAAAGAMFFFLAAWTRRSPLLLVFGVLIFVATAGFAASAALLA